jgi:hypothetical protein
MSTEVLSKPSTFLKTTDQSITNPRPGSFKMQANKALPIPATSPVEPQRQEQVNTSPAVQPATKGSADLPLAHKQAMQDHQVSTDPETLQAVQALPESRMTQNLTPVQRDLVPNSEMIQNTQLRQGLFRNGIQVHELSGMPLGTLTVDPIITLTPTPLPMPFPEGPVFIDTANAAPIETLHFIETSIFQQRRTWRATWHELRKQNIFMPLGCMMNLLQKWRAIVEIAMFRRTRRDENFSPDFLVILERYQNAVRRGEVDHLREIWQRLTSMLEGEENK